MIIPIESLVDYEAPPALRVYVLVLAAVGHKQVTNHLVVHLQNAHLNRPPNNMPPDGIKTRPYRNSSKHYHNGIVTLAPSRLAPGEELVQRPRVHTSDVARQERVVNVARSN